MTEGLSLGELKETPEWELLTPQQQRFLSNFITNGYNATEAVKGVYKVTTEESARVMGSHVLKSPAVILLLTCHWGHEQLPSFFRQCERMILKNKISDNQLKMMRLIAIMRGYIPAYGFFRAKAINNEEGEPMTLTEAGLAKRDTRAKDISRRSIRRLRANRRLTELERKKKLEESVPIAPKDLLDNYRNA